MSKPLTTVFFTLFVLGACWGQQSDNGITPAFVDKAPPDAPQLRTRETLRPPLSDVRANASPATDDLLIRLEGMRAKLSLSSQVGSKMPSGSAFQASLQEPLAVNGEIVLPKGTIFEGHLATVRARRRMRRGSVLMAFDRVVLPSGSAHPVEVNVVSAESSAVTPDAEGELHPNLTKKRLLIQVGGAGLAAKFGDDLAQLAGGTVVGAARARYFGMGASATFMLLQRGPDVKLNPGERLEIEFGRGGPAFPLSAKIDRRFFQSRNLR